MAYRHETVADYGSATAPGSGAELVDLAGSQLPHGRYLIRAECIFSAGTPAAAEDGNFVIRKGATPVKRLVTARVTGQQFVAEIELNLDGATDVSVNTNGAATAGVVYSASLSATRL
jgi:hypothetical protein